MLVPAGILITLLLGGIAFDLSVVFLRQRQASSTAVDLANDLATLALDEDRLRATGEYVLDPSRAESIALDLLRASDVGPEAVAIDVEVAGPETVTVTVTLAVDYVFAKAIPGAAGGTEVTASASAIAMRG